MFGASAQAAAQQRQIHEGVCSDADRDRDRDREQTRVCTVNDDGADLMKYAFA